MAGPVKGALGLWWEAVGLGIGHAWGVPHYQGLRMALWGGCRASPLDIAFLRMGTLEELSFPGGEAGKGNGGTE